MDKDNNIQLLLIVEVEKSQRVYCQDENCKHTVFKQIHIVRENGILKLYGSSCFAKKYHDLPNACKTPLLQFSAGGSLLSAEERQILIENTEALLRLFQDKFQEEERARKERLDREKREILWQLSKNRKVNEPPLNSEITENQNGELSKNILIINKFGDKYFEDLRSFELECKELIPNFSEQLLMRSIWVKLNDRMFETILEYERGPNRTLMIDLIIRYYRVGTRSDPWGFSLMLQNSFSIPKIVTHQVLSNFGLIKMMPQPIN